MGLSEEMIRVPPYTLMKNHWCYSVLRDNLAEDFPGGIDSHGIDSHATHVTYLVEDVLRYPQSTVDSPFEVHVVIDYHHLLFRIVYSLELHCLYLLLDSPAYSH